MKIPTILLGAATLGLAACDTVPPAREAHGEPGHFGDRYHGQQGALRYLTSWMAPDRALYILEGTRGASGIKRCGDDCRIVWPSLMAVNTPVGGPAINAAALSSRPAYGGSQVTYSGWPLYYYVRDTGPGDTTGQHVQDRWGMWHLVSPSGEPIRPAISRSAVNSITQSKFPA